MYTLTQACRKNMPTGVFHGVCLKRHKHTSYLLLRSLFLPCDMSRLLLITIYNDIQYGISSSDIVRKLKKSPDFSNDAKDKYTLYTWRFLEFFPCFFEEEKARINVELTEIHLISWYVKLDPRGVLNTRNSCDAFRYLFKHLEQIIVGTQGWLRGTKMYDINLEISPIGFSVYWIACTYTRSLHHSCYIRIP